MRWILLACFTALAFAQGTEPKPKAADYEVHGQSGDVGIGAEYMVHSFSGEGQTFIAEKYLIVEVALYPPKDGTMLVNNSAFALRIDGKKPALAPMSAEAFGTAMSRSSSQSGSGGSGTILGLPIPGRGGVGGAGGPLPRKPPPPSAGGGRSQQEVRAEDIAVRSALPEGEFKQPVSGFLYFQYRGKPSSIKSLELVYDRAVLKLR